jgi:hypothetical protein
MVLHLAGILVLGLMCGSELNVAAFGHPILNHQPLDTHHRMRSSLAALFGHVMPVWMATSTILNLLLLPPFAHLTGTAWRLAAIAFTIQVAAVVFSLVAPVPINNRIAKWTPSSLPMNWMSQEHRWDMYHWGRTTALIVAFMLLALSIGAR